MGTGTVAGEGPAHVEHVARQDWSEMHDGAQTLAAAISRMGGLGLNRRDWGKELREDIPLAVRRKSGRSLDDLVRELPRTYGWHFAGDSDLYAALSRRDDPQYSRAAFTGQARRDYDAEEPYTRLIAGTRQALRPARKRRQLKG